MLTRREMIISCATAMGAAVFGVPLVAKANDWCKTFSVLNFGVVSSENEADRIARYKTFVAYMERTMRAPIKMHQATDYAGTIEALKARKLEFARFGPAAMKTVSSPSSTVPMMRPPPGGRMSSGATWPAWKART